MEDRDYKQQMSSEASNKDEEFPSENIETKHIQCWHGSSETMKSTFLCLMRTRDFLSFILAYPITMSDRYWLRKWIDDAQALAANYCEHVGLFIKEQQSTYFLGEEGSESYPWMHMLSEKPLSHVEGIIAKDIESSFLNENRATLSEEFGASTNTSKGKQAVELTDVHDMIPQTIIDLAVEHAVHQLIQTLLMCNIHHIRFSTRNGSRTRVVTTEIQATLIGMQNEITDRYSRILWVFVPDSVINAEQWASHQIALWLNLVTTGGNMTRDEYGIFLTRRIEEEMTRMKHLVFLVDESVNRKLDTRKIGFPKKTLAGVVVVITNESSVQEEDELALAVDLKIRMEDHMLPWELFCRSVGIELVNSSDAIKEIAVQITKECGGHLLAILLVSKLLKNIENVELWELALHKLHHPNPSYDISKFHDVSRILVHVFINFIWDSINEKLKHCLRHCLYVPGIKDRVADHLIISCWVHDKIVSSQEEAKHILRELADRSILLQLKGSFIRLPEETYNILKSLTKLDSSNTVKQGGSGITEPTITEEWHVAKKIELTDDKLADLPLSPACPKLEVLLLQGNTDLMEIPPLFFSLMPQLLVLDLSFTSIRSLPSSFFDLKEIRELRLKECKPFREIPREIGRLKNLEVLDLDGTPIIYLPEQIQELTKLRNLTLTFHMSYHQNIGLGMNSVQYPRVVSPRVISKLTQLSYLSIDASPHDNRQWDDSVQVILQDISEIPKLMTLILYIPHVDLLKLVADNRNLDFRFVVGRHMQRIISLIPPKIEAKFKQSGCSLKFINGVDIPNDVSNALGHTNAFFLDRHENIKHLSEFELQNLEQLRVCIVGECNEMQTLIDGGCSYKYALPYLEFLCLFYMNNLRSICERKVVSRSCFCRLKTIALHTCPNLTTIFTMNFLDNLSKLEELIVEDCPKVSSLVSLDPSESKPTEKFFLPSLRKVSLLYLPELVSISNGLWVGPGLERIGFYDCPKFQSFSTMELSSQNLEVIKAEKEWWDALRWEKREWEKEGRLDFLNEIFFPINEEADIMDQLVRDDYESSRSKKKESQPLSGSERMFEEQKQNAGIRRITWSMTSNNIHDGTLVDDGYRWRKYGQKEILGHKFPRSYYRCTNRLCSGRKKVQVSDADPTICEISYQGMHTCRGKQASNAILDSSSSMDDFVSTPASKDDSIIPELQAFWASMDIPSVEDELQLGIIDERRQRRMISN